MPVIGLIADTHGYLDPLVFEKFEDCDEIWHLGDIGAEEILSQLKAFKATKAVYGNIDSQEMQWKLPEKEIIELEGLRFLLIHIAAKPPKYNKIVRDILNTESINVIICGHSHKGAVVKDRENNIVFLNPGAAGKQGFHQRRHVMKIHVDNKKITNLELIKLGNK